MKRNFEKMAVRIVMGFVILACLALAAAPTAQAGGKSGVWPVQLVPDGTYTSGVDSGASIYVVDLTEKARYTGNAIGQFTGVTLSGTGSLSGATLWPPDASTGISVYYTDLLLNPASGSSVFDLANWTLISATGDTLLSGNTYYAFDIPWNPAAPYGGIKFVWSGASQFNYGFRYSTSGNP